MKNIIIILFAFLAFNSAAQEYDSINQKDNKQAIGAYFSFDTKISELHNEYAIFTGIRLGVSIDHRYTIGFAGYSLEGNRDFTYSDHLGDIYNFRNEIYYGGLFVEYTFFPDLPVHISTPLLIGSGKMKIKEQVYLDQYEFENAYNREDKYWATVESSKFFVLEPGVSIEVDLLKWMRLGFGASYRSVIGNSLQSLPNADSDLSGFSFNINLKLGAF